MSRADDQRDAAALIRAYIEGDSEAACVVLDHGDLRSIAVQVASFAAALLHEETGSDAGALGYLDWVQRQLAEADS